MDIVEKGNFQGIQKRITDPISKSLSKSVHSRTKTMQLTRHSTQASSQNNLTMYIDHASIYKMGTLLLNKNKSNTN